MVPILRDTKFEVMLSNDWLRIGADAKTACTLKAKLVVLHEMVRESCKVIHRQVQRPCQIRAAHPAPVVHWQVLTTVEVPRTFMPEQCDKVLAFPEPGVLHREAPLVIWHFDVRGPLKAMVWPTVFFRKLQVVR